MPRLHPLLTGLLVLLPISALAQDDDPIDRRALVNRHDIDWLSLGGQIPLGNGNFAFNADGTGLETVGGNTMSHWVWHKFPLPAGVTEEQVVPWASPDKGRIRGNTATAPGPMGAWYPRNPHPLNLGRIAFGKGNGSLLSPKELQTTSRHLELWTGLLTTRFTYQGKPVTVETCVDPVRNAVAVHVESPLLQSGRFAIQLDFPSPSTPGNQDVRPQVFPGPWMGDFANPKGHQTEILSQDGRRIDVRRTIDATTYYASAYGMPVQPPPEGGSFELTEASWGTPDKETDVTGRVTELLEHGPVVASASALGGDPAPGEAKRLRVAYRIDGHEKTEEVAEDASWSGPQRGWPHRVVFDAGSSQAELVVEFSPEPITGEPLTFDQVKQACADHWAKFWSTGGAVDLSGSRDPRWKELERRIVLSQYETAVNSAGDYPPAEVGLTGSDPWSARFHLEMTWWHLAHFALWGRWDLSAKALDYYRQTMKGAEAIAKNFGYKGLMWPKTTGPDGVNDGYPPEMALLWRNPPPILFAELDYRLHPDQETLDRWKEIVLGTAEFMADYPVKEGSTYHLDPVWPACESPLGKDTIFELAEWRYVLGLAQTWRERLGMERDKHWDDVIDHLAPLPVEDGLYVYRANWDTYKKRAFDHLDIIGFAGMFPPFPGFDKETARRTLLEIDKRWDWESVWGWDFPWMAMAAARLGEPKVAVDALLNPAKKNAYDERGICTGGPGPYLPGNGGLLYAVAMMAAGWDGAPPDKHAPGFPDDGSWKVRWEGLKPAP